MKRSVWTFGFAVALLVVSVSSCNKKVDHSLGKFIIDIATVQYEGDNAYSLLLDNGKRLWPVASDVHYVPKDNSRAFVNFTTLSGAQNGYDHFVKVNHVWNILTKQIIDLHAHNEDSIGHDPARINAVWVGSDFLNIDFMFNYGGVVPHAINLVNNTLSSSASGDAIDLEFRHNAYDSANPKLYEGFVCFDLKPLQREDSDSVKLAIKVKEHDEEKTYNVVYRYNQAALKNVVAEKPIPVISSNEYY